jgi:hypothetical protein
MTRVAITLLAAAGLALVGLNLPVGARGIGGAVVPACSASPPSQATTAPASYSKLVVCADLATMNAVDHADTARAGFTLYRAPVRTADPITPAANITHDGTGVAVVDPSSQSGKGLGLAGRSASSPYYVGTPISGGFYVELDMKFNPTPPGGAGDWPAFWLANLGHWLAFTCPSSGYPYTELDMFEYYSGSIGNPALNLSDWDCVGGVRTRVATTGNSWSAAGIDFSSYHTYGFLWVPAATNGGTGLYKAYLDNVLKASCSYSADAPPSCDTGKPAGTYSSIETQGANVIVIGAYDVAGNPTTIRNLHVWQAP